MKKLHIFVELINRKYYVDVNRLRRSFSVQFIVISHQVNSEKMGCRSLCGVWFSLRSIRGVSQEGGTRATASPGIWADSLRRKKMPRPPRHSSRSSPASLPLCKMRRMPESRGCSPRWWQASPSTVTCVAPPRMRSRGASAFENGSTNRRSSSPNCRYRITYCC